jgi:hypothetical protein
MRPTDHEEKAATDYTDFTEKDAFVAALGGM